jgi:acetolactate synthase-1/2/3 large subunit
VGDVKGTLTQLNQVAIARLDKPRTESYWIQTVKEELQKFHSRIEKEGSSEKIPIQPQRLVKEIGEFMNKEDIVILDGGDTTVWGLTFLQSYFPKSVYFSGGLGLQHLGGGVPMAIATKYAYPEKRILVLTGDGYDLPFVVVISNDRLWGMVARTQKLAHGKKVFGLGSSLSDETRYDKYAEAFNCYGELITDPNEIRPALQRAYDSGIPAVLDTRVNPKVNTVMDYLGAGSYKPQAWVREVKKQKKEVSQVVSMKK